MRYNQQCTTATCRFTVEELDYWKAGDVVVPENAPLTINNLNFKTVPPPQRNVFVCGFLMLVVAVDRRT